MESRTPINNPEDKPGPNDNATELSNQESMFAQPLVPPEVT